MKEKCKHTNYIITSKYHVLQAPLGNDWVQSLSINNVQRWSPIEDEWVYPRKYVFSLLEVPFLYELSRAIVVTLLYCHLSLVESLPRRNLLSWKRSSFDCNNTAQKMKFSVKDFLSKCDQIRSLLRIWSHLLMKSLMKNFIFCALYFLQKIPL